MKTVLIGHRGAGKSALLKRIKAYFDTHGSACIALDLDTEIARRTGKSAGEIFSLQGESEFRRLERETFAQIEHEVSGVNCDVFLCLGAGFDPALVPTDWRALWVRRPTDRRGRIFVDPNRPRLNPDLPRLAEYHERFPAREDAYRARADDVLLIDEGLESENAVERAFFLDEFSDLGAALTLLPEHFSNRLDRRERSDGFDGLNDWLERRLRWGVRWFELRDDLLDDNQIRRALALLPRARVLASFRSPDASATLAEAVRAGVAFDWPVEKGACPFGEPTFFSLHERLSGQSLSDALERLKGKALLKAALPVADFHELEEGHRWREQDPARRVFLPHSRDGRWAWYRLLTGPNSPLSFIRESDGSSADQPTLLQWARRRALRGASFAAVLGDPVNHSRTPLEQAEFFSGLDAPVFAIRMSESELSALDFVRSLGLRWAAVTAPLKGWAFRLCGERTLDAEALGAVNTLVWLDDHWLGTNTDHEGFRALIAGRQLGCVAIWGGGGTLAMMKSVLPQAECFSFRTRENRDPAGACADKFRPDTIVWAAAGAGDPPEEWRPARVIDLNYFEDSPAREFALNRGADYVSGLAMFHAQAKGQRVFWIKTV